MVVWLIRRGWGRLLLLVMAEFTDLAAFTGPRPPRPFEP
jgi:hypothetical protein